MSQDTARKVINRSQGLSLADKRVFRTMITEMYSDINSVGGGAFTADADTQITPDTAIVLDQATGNEIALDLSYTVNKATSGNDTGLLINMTDTASPGTSLLADFQVGGTSLARFDNAGQLQLDPSSGKGSTTGITFGAGQIALYESSTAGRLVLDSADLRLYIGGTYEALLNATGFQMNDTNGPILMGENASSTNPTLVPNKADLDTGLGHTTTADQLSLIAGGVEGIRITEGGGGGADIITTGSGFEIHMDKTTEDAPFFNFQATADGDATSAISTLTTSGSVTHHIQIEINGVTAWIPCSTTDPS